MDALPTSFSVLRTVYPVRIRSFGLSAQDLGEAKPSCRSRMVGGVDICKHLDLFKKTTNVCGVSVLGKHFALGTDRC